MSNIYYVYVHRRATDNSVFYVGKGNGGRASSKSARNRYWYFVVAKHGFIYEIIQSEMNESDAFALEIETIKKFRADGAKLVNMTDGGEGASGNKQSYESIRKSADKKIGVKRPIETVKKMSESTKGRYMSEEWRRKISEAHTGRRQSDELRKKRADAQKKKVQCSNGMIFHGITTARDWLRANGHPSASGSGISMCCLGQKLTCHGFKWSYANVDL